LEIAGRKNLTLRSNKTLHIGCVQMIPTSFHHRNIISSFHYINYFPIHSYKNRLSAKKQLTKHLQANQWTTQPHGFKFAGLICFGAPLKENERKTAPTLTAVGKQLMFMAFC
jgi:hypothetical protein